MGDQEEFLVYSGLNQYLKVLPLSGIVLDPLSALREQVTSILSYSTETILSLRPEVLVPLLDP